MDDLSDSSFLQAMQFQENPDAADKQLAVRFYEQQMEDPAATRAEGRPIFKTVDCCEIRIPGDKDNIINGPCKYLKPDPRTRFPGAYARYKAKAQVQVKGTLLREWGLIPTTRALEYQHFNVFTVEQLAELADAHVGNIKGAVAERQKARDFLEMAKGQAPLAQARAEAEELRSELATLRDIVREQGDRLEALSARDEGNGDQLDAQQPTRRRRGQG